MLCIKLAELSLEESQSALDYAKCAVEHKETNPTLADSVIGIAMQELNHMETLYKEGLKLLEKHPENKAIFDYLHQRALENASEAKSYQSLYR